MGLVEAIYPALGTVDYKQPLTKLVFIGGSLLFFTAVFVVCALGSYGIKTYRNLRSREKVFWNLAVVRALYGVFCTVMGSWAIFWDEVAVQDVVHATTPTGFVTIYVTVGFFLFETLASTTSDLMFGKFNPLLNAHHLVSLLGHSLVAYYGCFHYLGVGGLILEMSTPFSALCWVLLKTGLAESMLWKINQMILVHTFHLRSVVECFLWYQTYKHWGKMWHETPFPLLSVFLGGLFMFSFVMTPYWCYKKTAQLFNPIDWNFSDSRKHGQTNGYAVNVTNGNVRSKKSM
ncbi:PREDICTED: protein CLN8-like [Branchiostoma belcheri]|uniref:Protein CLN8-like n=1 Tax=Branchiostoma belcheri TaxID=7741 RepID=A0A6P5AG28_BRABE|nr:PREDICTED: protein CLN8-like [Branchiostoma belcheri]